MTTPSTSDFVGLADYIYSHVPSKNSKIRLNGVEHAAGGRRATELLQQQFVARQHGIGAGNRRDSTITMRYHRLGFNAVSPRRAKLLSC